MKTRTVVEGVHLIVLDPEDEFVECLTRFARERSLLGGSFQAIGAASRAVYAYWDRERKVYDKFEIPEQMEVVSLTGNLARDEAGEVRIHAHVVFSGRDGSTLGGHLFEAHVYPTLEIVLTEAAVPLRRKKHPDTGLMLLDMEE